MSGALTLAAILSDSSTIWPPFSWPTFARNSRGNAAVSPGAYLAPLSSAQLLWGLEFMHSDTIAHRDACDRNLAMDASKLMPGGYHFSTHGPRMEMAEFRVSGETDAPDDTVPELSETVPYNPFKVDIYQLGNVFKNLIPKYPVLDTYFGTLLDAMTNVAPEGRPTASVALPQFEEACSLILVSELGSKTEFRPQSPFYSGESDTDYVLDTDSESSLSDEEVDGRGDRRWN
ncbi:hypothetical protein C8F01DRAFT_1263228 [Mycena amicta]|nr:hypothetical protein C8F01DRAFT_1263228 [Mycena amicta]